MVTRSKRTVEGKELGLGKKLKIGNETQVKVEGISRSVKIESDPEIKNEVKNSLISEISSKEDVKVKLEHIKVEIETEEIPPNVFPRVAPEDSEVGPKNWSSIYNEIVSMRSKFMAPVDTQGCERMPNTINPNVKTRNPRVYRFQLLISLMLSSQTKDEVNFQAMKNLQTGLLAKGFADGLCIEAVLGLTEKEIDGYICKVGFHNRKSTYIKQACLILQEKFNGDIPKTIEDIVTLPGVGPKMGYLLLQNGWGINSGIGVDVHLHRLAQMWGWTSKNVKTPEHTRLELEKWLPEKYWADINPLLVGFGQVICVPRASNCDICSLGSKGLCKSSNKKLTKGTITTDRLSKLMKQRADLSKLISENI
ncbi:DNA glycosylase [Scheffersomyces xylosifermentans]|uniref:DNA glycosylase n=1 Tax=Scheffersomyces xylosifermentans TaxID=1304137 RepID=UPI00315DD459